MTGAGDKLTTILTNKVQQEKCSCDQQNYASMLKIMDSKGVDHHKQKYEIQLMISEQIFVLVTFVLDIKYQTDKQLNVL